MRQTELRHTNQITGSDPGLPLGCSCHCAAPHAVHGCQHCSTAASQKHACTTVPWHSERLALVCRMQSGRLSFRLRTGNSTCCSSAWHAGHRCRGAHQAEASACPQPISSPLHKQAEVDQTKPESLPSIAEVQLQPPHPVLHNMRSLGPVSSRTAARTALMLSCRSSECPASSANCAALILQLTQQLAAAPAAEAPL